MTAGVFSQSSVNLFPLISRVCDVMWCGEIPAPCSIHYETLFIWTEKGVWCQVAEFDHEIMYIQIDAICSAGFTVFFLWIRGGRNDETEETYCCVTGWDDCSFSVHVSVNDTQIYLWFDFKVVWYDRKRTSTWLLVVFFSCFHSSVCSQGKLLNSPPAAIEKCKPKHPTVTEFPKQHCDLFYSGSRSNKCVFTRTFFISSLRWIWALSTDSDTQYYNY